MTTQNYLMINESNIVGNIIVWDGNTETWQPPAGYFMLVQATTPALIWVLDSELTPPDFVLEEVVGAGSIGFSWNGSFLTINQRKPEAPKNV